MQGNWTKCNMVNPRLAQYVNMAVTRKLVLKEKIHAAFGSHDEKSNTRKNNITLHNMA